MAPNTSRNLVLRNAIARILALSIAAAAQQALPANSPCSTSPDQTTQTCTTDQGSGVYVWSGSLRRLEVRALTTQIRPPLLAGVTFVADRGNDAVIVLGSPLDPSVVVRTTRDQQGGVVALSMGLTPPPPASARDPFLGIFMPGDPGVPNGRADVTNYADIGTGGANAAGITATSASSGYSTAVTGQTFSATGFQFTITQVHQPEGAAVAAGSTVAGVLVDARGQVLRDASGAPRTAGTFTVGSDLTINYSRGTAFDSLAVDETAYVALDYVVHGVSPVSGSSPIDIDARVLVSVRRADANTINESRVSYFSRFGIQAWPEPAAGAAWTPRLLPNLQAYVDEQLANAATGARGGTAAITNLGVVHTTGAGSHGLRAETYGASGAAGRDGSLFRSAREGAPGRNGGDAIVTADGSIVTEGLQATGVLASSVGGTGGSGGNGGTFRWGQAGGTGGNGGQVFVYGDGDIRTENAGSSGIFAVSHGGLGGAGGTGEFVTPGGNGGIGGQGGDVTVTGQWNIETRLEASYGIWAKSVGGDAGSGGSGGWLAGAPGNGGQATDGGTVRVESGGTILTRGANAVGIHAQSIGGFGGSGGGGFSLFYSRGGSGASAGSGSDVFVTQDAGGSITTLGAEAHGILAESIGGGGGSGGDTSGFIARGGNPGYGGNGGDVTVANAGYIATWGAGAYGILAQSVGGGGGDGGSAKGAGALGGEGRAGGWGGEVTLTNLAAGEVYALGAHSVGLFAQSVGGGGGNGGSSSGIVPIGGRGSETSNGGSVRLSNAGLVYSNSYGLFAQSIGGGGGNGGQATGWFSFGGDGGGGGAGLGVTVTNSGEVYTRESDASGIFAQSVGGGGGSGGSAIAVGASVAVAIGGNGAKGGNGGDVVVDSHGGYVWTQGDRSRGIQAQSVGGGGGSGGYAFAGSAGPGFSIAAAFGGSGSAGGLGGNVVLNSRTDIGTQGADAHGLFAQSVGGGGGSGGFSIALSASDIFAGSAAFGGTAGAGGSAGTVRMGSADAPLDGYIATAGTHSYGVLAQSVGGGGGDGGFSVAGAIGGAVGASLSFGGNAGVGGAGNDVDVYAHNTIDTMGDDSHGLFAQSVGGGGGSGGFSVTAGLGGAANLGASFGGAGGAGALAGDVLLDSTGEYVHTVGRHAYGIVAQSIGGSGGDGGFSVGAGLSAGASVNFAMGGTGGAGGLAGDVSLSSRSNVDTAGADSYGVFAQSVGGGGGSGGFSVGAGISAGASVNAALGGGGGGGGHAGTVTLTSGDARVRTAGDRSHGLFAQSVGGSGGSGGFSVGAGLSASAGVSFGMGGAGGAGALAGDVALDSDTSVGTLGADSHAIFAQSVGGGGGAGGFSVAAGITAGAQIGVSLGGDGAAGGNAGDVDVASRGRDVFTHGDRSHGVLAQSIGGSGGNAGFSVAGGLSTSASVNFALGGGGGDAGIAGDVRLDSTSDVVTEGDDSYALFAQSVGGGGGAGGFSVGAGITTSAQVGVSLGGGGGEGGNAGTVYLDSAGTHLSTYGARSYGVLAQSVGGSGGSGGFSVAGGISNSANVNFAMGGDGGAGSAANSVVLLNSSLVDTAGAGAHGLFAQSVGGGGGAGGFSVTGGMSASSVQIGASIGGGGGDGSTGGSVTLRTDGDLIQTAGDRAYGVLAQSVGGTGGDGGFAVAGGLSLRGSLPAINFALGGSGGTGSTGGAVRLDSASTVHTSGAAAHGLMAQSVGGGGGSGGFAVAGGVASKGLQVSVGLGGSGGSGGNASGVVLTSTGGQVFTEGERAFGLFAQSVGGGGGDGGFGAAGGTGDQASIQFAMGGNGGGAGTGADVRVENASAVTTVGTSSHGIVAQSVGGGGGAGGLALTGSLARGPQSRSVSVGIGGYGGGGGSAGDVTVSQQGELETFGDRAYGVLAQSVGGGGGDGGLAKVVNLLEEYKAPEIPDALLDEQDKGKPKSLSFGISVGAGGEGGDAGVGGDVAITNTAGIFTHGLGSHALFAQSIGGSGGAGGLSAVDGTGGNGEISIDVTVGVGGKGGGGGNAGSVSVASSGTLATLGAGAHGIVAQSVGGGGGSGGASAVASKGAGSDAKVGVTVDAGIGGSGGVAGDGSAVSVTNDGTIDTSGAYAYGIFAQSVGGGGGDGGNSAVVMGEQDDEDEDDDAADSGSGGDEAEAESWTVGIGIGAGGGGGGSGVGGDVDVVTAGSIVTRGAGSHGIFAQSIGGSGGAGGVAATTSSGGGGNVAIELGFSLGGSGGGGGAAGAVDVSNTGSILTVGAGAHGVFAQSVGGGGGAGGSSLASSPDDDPEESDDSKKPEAKIAVTLDVAVGGSGAKAGDGGSVRVGNDGRIETQGYGSYAVLAQSVGGGGGHGGLSIATPGGSEDSSFALGVAIGGGGDAGGQGGKVEVASTGDLVTFGDDAIAVFAQSVGGGGGAGGSSVAASGGAKWAAIDVAIGGGAGGGNLGGDVEVTNAGDVDTVGSAAHGIYAQSVGGGGGRGGNAQTIKADEDTGATDSGDAGNDEGSSGGDDGGSNDGFKFGLSLGGSGGGASSGGTVTVTQDGTIRTRGQGAHGVFAQSVGGGGGEGGYGGFAGKGQDEAGWTLPSLELQLALGGSGGAGARGGNVEFTGTGDVVTLGDASIGVLLQSVGGGGGVGGLGLATASGSLALGGAGTAGGDGGDVTAGIDGSIETFGRAAFGLLAQSVGGGGGAAGDVTAGIDPLEGFGLGLAIGRDGGTGGDGGDVAITTTGDVYTHGDGAIGLFAQSVGGGGGLGGTAVGTLPFAGSVGGVGAGGRVTVTHDGDVVTTGRGAHGIVAQSAGGTGTGAAVDIVVDGNVVAMGHDSSGIVVQSRGESGGSNLRVELLQGGAVLGGSGSGAGVTMLDGADNLLINRGLLGSVDGLTGYALTGRDGAETVRNYGTIVGLVDLGGGPNAFHNEAGALLESGASLALGMGNVLYNAGSLSPGGLGTLMSTTVVGDYAAATQAQHWFDVDLGAGRADALLVTGAVTLDGTLHLQFTGLPTATAQHYALVTGAGAYADLGLELGESTTLPAAFVIGLTTSDGSTWLDLQPDFTLAGAGLSGNAGAVGAHLNSIVGAGPGAGMQALLDTVVTLPTAADLEKAFRQLQPTPYAALPAGATVSQLRFNDALLSCRTATGEYRFSGETDCAWARASTWQLSRDGDATAGGFEQESLEASLGVQKGVGADAHWFVGMGLSIEDTQTEARPNTRSDGELLQLGGVVKGLFGPFSSALSFGAGRGEYDTTRRVPIAGEGVTARSSQDLTLYSGNLRLAWDFVGAAWYLRPLVDVDYAHVSVDAFREHGAGVANLRVAASSEDFVAIRPAIEAGAEFDSTTGTLLRPFVRLGTTQVVEGETQVLNARFEGDAPGVAPFTVEREGEDSFVDVALGLDLLRASGPSLRFSYGGQFASGSELLAVSLKLWVPLR